MSKRGWFWALLPVVMLVTTAVGVLVVVSIAVADPGFSVEKDYYRRALDHNAELDQQKRNAQLGWSLSARIVQEASGARVVAELRDRELKPIVGASLSAEAFALARGQRTESLSFVASEPGVYSASLVSRRPGLWELRFRAQLGSDRFTRVVREDIAPVPKN